jgi:hypothetical protein
LASARCVDGQRPILVKTHNIKSRYG